MTNVPPPAPVWDAQPPGSAATGYGGFWIRVVAYIIDIILLDAVLWVAASIMGLQMIPTHYAVGDDLTDALGNFQLMSLAVTWLYFSLMESSARGATVGKMAVGLRVVTDQGERLSFLRATGRFFAKFISALLFGIGFLMVAFTDRKRGLHDMIAGTLVVKAR